jgi:hypothetical protein
MYVKCNKYSKLERGGVMPPRPLLVADPGDKNVAETVVQMTSIRSTGEQVVFISAQGQSEMVTIQILARLCTTSSIVLFYKMITNILYKSSYYFFVLIPEKTDRYEILCPTFSIRIAAPPRNVLQSRVGNFRHILYSGKLN